MRRALPILTALLLLSASARAQTIKTIAGGGPHNIPALQTSLPCQYIAVDTAGNLYCSATQLHQIWKIDTQGKLNLFAGTGFAGFSGDGGQALNASLSYPQGLAFNNAGDLLVTDTGNVRIRKISPSGIIQTIAGTDDSTSPNYLPNPQTICLDSSGNLYIIADAILRMTPAGVLSRFAGGGRSVPQEGDFATSVGLNPTGIATDSIGSLYIADANPIAQKIYRVTNGQIHILAGRNQNSTVPPSNLATNVDLSYLDSVAVDRFDNVYSLSQGIIRVVAPNQLNIATFAGTGVLGSAGDGGPATSATIGSPRSMVFDSTGTAFFTDGTTIRKISGGIINTYAGTNHLGPANGSVATDINLLPYLPTLDLANNLIFPDDGSNTIQKLNLGTGLVTTIAGGASPVSVSYYPRGLTIDSAGTIYFTDDYRVRKIVVGVPSVVANVSGAQGFSGQGDGGPATAAAFCVPSALAVAKNLDLYVVDCNTVRRIDGKTGLISTVAGTGYFDNTLQNVATGDGGPATSANIFGVRALTLDGRGNLYITETGGNRIRKVVLSSNIISTVAGNSTRDFADGVLATSTGLSSPFSTFVDDSGNLFISDTGYGHVRVRKVSASSGLISSILGNGSYGFTPDGAPPTAALGTAVALTIDRSQNLYFTDTNRIRTIKIQACFFTFSTPTVYRNKNAGTGAVTITATDPSCPYTLTSDSPFVTITGNPSGTGSGTVSFTVAAATGASRTANLSIGGANLAIQQAGPAAPQNIGFFQPTNGPLWALDTNGNGTFDAADQFFSFTGQPGAIAVAGDWNGDGRTKVGYYLNGFWALDYNGNGVWDGPSGGDKFYAFGGGPSYVPVVGDWNGDGRTKIGYYNGGFWALDTNGNGTFDSGDSFFGWGGNGAGEVPLVGDWNGNGRTKIGYFYQGKWVLDTNGNGQFDAGIDRYSTTFPYSPGDKPVTGDWTGDGIAKMGIYRNGFWILDANNNGTYDGALDKFYAFGGRSGDTPIVGDWSGNGRDKVGVYNAGFWVLDVNGNGSFDGVGPGQDRFNGFGGTPGNQPLIGRW